MSHRRFAVPRHRREQADLLQHLAEAARLWFEIHGAPEGMYSTVGNGFLVAAERAWCDACPEPPDRRSAIVLWRDMNRRLYPNGGHFVYYFWSEMECLYVGVSSTLFSRLRHHEKRFGHLTDRVEVREFNFAGGSRSMGGQ